MSPCIMLLAGMLLLSGYSSRAQKKPVEAFRIKEKDLIPEGIAYDPVGKNFYVGSIHKRKIVQVNAKGKVSDFAVSLGEVLGMKVDEKQRKLWVCSNSPEYDSGNFVSSVYVFSLEDGALLKRYQLSGKKKHLFNDLEIASTGDVFVTDSDGGGIYVIKKASDSIEEFIKPEGLRYPNGIALSADEKRIFVSTGSSMGIVSIEVSTKKIAPVAHEKFMLIGIDGLYRYGDGFIAIQNVTFPESVLKLQCDSAFTKVEAIRPVASDLSQFDLPTTGVLVKDCFYFIANSQIRQVAGNKGAIRQPENLQEVIIMMVELNP